MLSAFHWYCCVWSEFLQSKVDSASKDERGPMIPNHPVIQILIILGTITILQSFGSNPVRRIQVFLSAYTIYCVIWDVQLRGQEWVIKQVRISKFQKLPEFWGINLYDSGIFQWSPLAEHQSSYSHTFRTKTSHLLFIMFWIRLRVCREKVEKHKEFDISIFPFFQASISAKIDNRIQTLKRHLCLHLLPLMILFPANTPQLPSMHWLCNYLEKLLLFVYFYPTESFWPCWNISFG